MTKTNEGLNVTYCYRGCGTVYHPSKEIAIETADKFKQIANSVSRTHFHKLDGVRDFIFPLGDEMHKLDASSEIMNAAKLLEETGRPTLSYNNGMYCFVGYETQSKTDRSINLEPAVYLFTDKDLAEALRKELGEMDGTGYVPCSNGETNYYGEGWVDTIKKATERKKQTPNVLGNALANRAITR